MSETNARLRGLLIDLDGTLYHGTSRIDGADRLIAYINEIKLPYQFVTNNSSTSAEEVAGRLSAMGIPAQASDVCTSAQATAGYIADQAPGASVFVIGEVGLRSALQEAGCRLTDDEQPDFVVQGIDRSMSYERMARAVRYIRAGAAYVMTNPDLLLPSSDGLIPGAGSIGAMLQAASGEKPVVIGKPSSILMDYSLRRLGVHHEETWVVGDNIATDIAAGLAAGCKAVLVLTGLTHADNVEQFTAAAGCRPDRICNTLDDLRQEIASNLSANSMCRED
ncbi:TIGR01457 family HAD-type hydrolase [Paenibacillus sp. 1011MAR3C5]|uniref:TIGR01457 family HAD-type hydrolase n=1 Tax=Paenibacillus sp. 1011MAR3C5 TaxID=1675787 RepID=UPI000E6C8190|nr:TIGR01457 family HAD-type hydrolase [Paenibacillus sp. 1011MAR3C5]RJE90178.1 TIGR01457 family HAD-type hydrolase [Paenibacillus sp. 1011MAR3C5]